MRELEDHLASLKQGGFVSTWHDGCITAGQEWESEIEANLGKSEIILLLISKDFIASEYCCQVEAPKAIKLHREGRACVIPVILRSCVWKPTRIEGICLKDLQALPTDAKPVSRWKHPDDAFTSIVEGIYEKIKQLQYTRFFAEAVAAEYPLNQQTIDQLTDLQEKLGLQYEEITRIEHPIRKLADTNYKQQQQQRQQLEESKQREKAKKYYQKGKDYWQQSNYRQAIADLTQAKEYGHPDAERILTDLSNGLGSEKGIDYSKLRDLLKAEKWKKADNETYSIFKELIPQGWSSQALMNFPLVDLLTIDRLWLYYSNGKYSFSVQKKIYLQCGGVLDGKCSEEVWNKFGDTVGWRRNGFPLQSMDLKYNGSGPDGHLPLGCVPGISPIFSHPGLGTQLP